MTQAKPTRPCHICGSADWWWRPASQWGPGEWLCGCCHPDPNKEVCRGKVDNPGYQLVTGATGAFRPAPAPNKEAQLTAEKQAEYYQRIAAVRQ